MPVVLRTCNEEWGREDIGRVYTYGFCDVISLGIRAKAGRFARACAPVARRGQRAHTLRE
jgi:hypothetical protein